MPTAPVAAPVATPCRPKNKDVRTREHLTGSEVDRLVAAASKVGRHGERDGLMLEMMYRHGLRLSELTSLRWSEAHLDQGFLHVTRAKGGVDSTHPIDGNHIRVLRRIKREQTGLLSVDARDSHATHLKSERTSACGLLRPHLAVVSLLHIYTAVDE